MKHSDIILCSFTLLDWCNGRAASSFLIDPRFTVL
uniref:Uncharacterized protein n=1 Tax=Anguilla anguilla TaxID=7936 RepID=A0A0E9TS17_ANGAN